MTPLEVEQEFPRGLLSPELFIGVLSSVMAQAVRFNLSDAGAPSGSHYLGGRYGKGEVGEFVLIEGQVALLLGRIIEVHLPGAERRAVDATHARVTSLDAVGTVQLLGSVAMDTLQVTAGVDSYPRLGDRIYAAPHKFVAKLPVLMERDGSDDKPITLRLGAINGAQESAVSVRPEKLFGRHCAILGSTGGGKSWTTSRIIEECLQHKAKIILLDATGEYRGLNFAGVRHRHLGHPVEVTESSKECSLPPTSFIESDFIALFEPAGKVQGPKLRAAIRSLRLAKLVPQLAPEGVIRKLQQPRKPIEDAEQRAGVAELLDDPKQPFDVSKVVLQLEQECAKPPYNNGPTWGGESGDFSYCLPLVTRINAVLTTPSLKCVFRSAAGPITEELDDFAESGDRRLLRICLSGIAYEFHAREIVANVIGRHILNRAREGAFKTSPIVVMVDEAHNFLGKHIGNEDSVSKLDAFELIAREGRKYGLSICLATQRPRDITEGVLSQMGTLIVHRLTNERDREVVERACGEIDRSASAFLPNLKPGEAAIIGADFPIPLTVQIYEPTAKPLSDGPNYQRYWKLP